MSTTIIKMIKINLFPRFLLLIGVTSSLLVFNACTTKPTVTTEPTSYPQEENNSAPDPQALKHFMDGQMYMNQGDYALAILEFQEALELDPEAGAIFVSMAECYWNLGKPDQAEKQLKKALEIDPKDTDALEMLGNEYILRKRYSEAERIFSSLIGLDSTKTNYFVTMGELAKIRKDFSTAINYYRKAFVTDPERVEYLETAGQFALHIQDYSVAETVFKQLVSIEPDHIPYISTYVDLILEQEHYQEGIAFFEKLNKEHGKTADRLIQLGLLAYKAGQQDKAFLSVKQAIEMEPSNPDYLSTLIDLYMNDEAFDSVRVLADSFIVAFPGDSRGYVNRALIAFNLKNPASVVNILTPVANDFPDDFLVHYLLGLSFNQLKNYTQAEVFLKQAETIRPESRTVKHSLALLYDIIKEWELSDSLYQALINSDSTDAQALNNYAYSLSERGLNLDQAFLYAQKAVALESDNSAYLDTMGWIYFKLNKISDALEYLRQSIEINDSNPIVLEHYGDVLMENNQKDIAKTVYQKALKLDSENKRLKKKAETE